MTTLYKLTEQMHGLNELLADSEDMAQAVADTMEGLELEFNQKAENILFLTKNLDTNISAIDDEIKRLQARKKVVINKQESLKEYLRSNMADNDINKIECDLFTITLKKAAKIVKIDDASKLPTKLRETVRTISYNVNKKALKDALEMGAKINGAHLEDAKRGLLIK